MKVVQWNVSKVNAPMTALRKYEDYLYHFMLKEIRKKKLEISVSRIRRSSRKFFGSTVISWLLSYRRKGADIVHATFQTLAPAGFIRRPRRFVITVHDLAPLRYPHEIRDVSEKIQWTVTPKAIGIADAIVAISEFVKKEVSNVLRIDEDRVVVVYQGVDHDVYKPMDRDLCLEHFGLDPEKRYLLYVASNLPHKRVDLAKAVFDEVRKCREDVMMIKAGYSERLHGRNVISMGWIAEEDMPKLYNCADVYVHTSEYEGFGLPVLEAMACGRWIVALNRASVPEILGKAGTLVEPDVKEFAEAVLKALDRKGLNRKALERAKRFSWEKTARETLKVYEEVCS